MTLSPALSQGRGRLVVAACILILAGCEKTYRNMYDDARKKPLAPSTLFADGRSARPPVAGTVAHSAGDIAGSSSGRKASQPKALTAAERLERGHERFAIYCEPCHGPRGDGDGRVVQRGFPKPPSYLDARLRAAPDQHFYDVITQGYGVMYPYGDRVPAEDRWAIVAWIRSLQERER